jgi:succinoglycan biosynthesis protein ExoM
MGVTNGQASDLSKPLLHQPNNSPIVSFIMAARNVGPYIEAAIISALKQSIGQIEIIVVDDASDDDTAAKVAALIHSDARVSLIRSSSPMGPSAARNQALAAARGEWISILDADDLIAPERTEYLLYLAGCVDADIIADNSLRFDDRTGVRKGTILELGRDKYAFAIGTEDFLLSNRMFSGGAGYGYLKPMFRTAFLRQFSIQYDEKVVIGEDFFFCLDCLLRGARYYAVSEAFYYYRIRTFSTSHRMLSRNVEQLMEAHRSRFPALAPSAPVRDAAERYLSALERALTFTHFVEALKAGQFAQVFRLGLTRPDVWPLFIRFGTEALVKRAPLGWQSRPANDTPLNLSDLAVEERQPADYRPPIGKIAICVCTYRRREGLRSLLNAIDRQVLGGISSDEIVVVIVDNDPEQSATPICSTYGERGRFRLHALHEGKKGLSNVRNLALDAARAQGADRVVFVDDDEIPNRFWLVSLLRGLGELPTCAVLGPVYPLYEAQPPRWAIRGGFFSMRKQHVADKAGNIHAGYIGNSLLSMPVIDKAQMRFDARFNQTGGEDTMFFQTLLDAGFSIGWSEGAGLWETIPAPRMSVLWLLRRWYRTGNIEAHLGKFDVTSILGRCANFLRGLARVGLGSALVVIACVRTAGREPSAIIARLYTVSRGAGLLAAALGGQYNEYSNRRYR